MCFSHVLLDVGNVVNAIAHNVEQARKPARPGFNPTQMTGGLERTPYRADCDSTLTYQMM